MTRPANPTATPENVGRAASRLAAEIFGQTRTVTKPSSADEDRLAKRRARRAARKARAQ